MRVTLFFYSCIIIPANLTVCSLASRHRFTEEENDWGFTRLANLEHIHHDDQKTSRGPLLQGDQIRATAIVRIYKDSTGVLWHNFIR